jgi:hypothetical protein
MTAGDIEATKAKKGYAKIENSCKRAAEDGLSYIWADTACIDKSSSAELDEAIRSMFRWYNDAAICYAYLSDLDFDPAHNISSDHFRRAFESCRWFTRGWTPQELIAPLDVLFFDKEWKYVTSRLQHARYISVITGISHRLLRWPAHPHEAETSRISRTGHLSRKELRNCLDDYSAAQRISWASSRRTTRVEDRAYSLFGLLNVHMPVVYGEGENAFIRLQETILSLTRDDSVLAWDTSSGDESRRCPLFATSPSEFSGSGNIIRRDWGSHGASEALILTGEVLKWRYSVIGCTDINLFRICLDCSYEDSDNPLCLWVDNAPDEAYVVTRPVILSNRCSRLHVTTREELKKSSEQQSVALNRAVTSRQMEAYANAEGIRIHFHCDWGVATLLETYPPDWMKRIEGQARDWAADLSVPSDRPVI